LDSSFSSWFNAWRTGALDEWESKLATKYEEWYNDIPDKRAVWVKEGILESYKAVTDTYKTQVAGVVGGALSWMVAQLAAGATTIPLEWNLLTALGALLFATLIHFRMNYKVSIISARMGGITKAKGGIFEPTVEVQ